MASAGHTSARPTEESEARLVLGQRIAAGLCVVGSITAYIGAFTLHMTEVAKVVQLALAVGYTALGIGLAVTRPRQLVTQIALFWAVFGISAMLATADSFGTTPFFYLWPAVFAAYFCTPRVLVAILVWLAGTLMGALVISPIAWAVKADTFIGVTVSVGLMAALV
ncbi:MAG: hypothetical protein AAGC46_10610, partial [Solirubrobacteraceae bacterium]|nr:hypothetical protein [Patulibacter sp.]